MSVICQNFVQNAWKKDLCSNCFKSVGDHESLVNQAQDNVQNGQQLNQNYVTHESSIFPTRNTPHTTWKSLISEKNSKNSQPFKLENGFQGRLLTINKALNATEKQNGIENNQSSTKLSVKSIVKKAEECDKNMKSERTSKQDTIKANQTNDKPLNQNLKPTNVCTQKTILQNGSSITNGHTDTSYELGYKPTSLQSILKKQSTVNDNTQMRRSNVGFKDEEPLVIGYGGRDFSPDELEWEMASSDGETENANDSLDETEDDKKISKITQQNTEFNSDNSNLLINNMKIQEVKISRLEANTKNTRPDAAQNSEHNKTEDSKKHEANTKNSAVTEKSPQTDLEIEKTENKFMEKSDNKNSTGIPFNTENVIEKITNSEVKNIHDSINVAIRSDKISHAGKSTEISSAESKPASSAGNDKNSTPLINGAVIPLRSVGAPDSAGSKKDSEVVMFSDGDTTWKKNASNEGSEWQNSDEVSCEILQAINTSLTNRQEMQRDQEINREADISESTNEVLQIEDANTPESHQSIETVKSGTESAIEELGENFEELEPRASFLHGVPSNLSKPNAIYGPASDLFMSRSSSSSSSSSEGTRKSQISINVIVNGGESIQTTKHESNNESKENTDGDTCTNDSEASTPIKEKPKIPIKPAKFSEIDTLQNNEKTNGEKNEIYKKSNSIEDNIENEYYSVSDGSTITLVDHYAETNIYHEVGDKTLKVQEQTLKTSGRESKLAALAIELEQARLNGNTKRQAPAPPSVPDPPVEDPPSCTGRTSPLDTHNFSTFRGESIGFSSASSTTSTSSQDTETGYASWNLHGDSEDQPKHSKSKTSFLLTQYSKCKMLAMGYAEDGVKARKKFSLKKLLKLGRDPDSPVLNDNGLNSKAWKYSDNFERPRAKLEIIHPMDLENKSVTVNPGFDSLHCTSMTSFTSTDSNHRNSVSSDYGSFYSDTMTPGEESKHEVKYEYIQSKLPVHDEQEESRSKTETSSSTSPTPSRSSLASQASNMTSGSSKNGSIPPHRPPKPPPPPRAHSLLPGNKAARNSDGTFKIPIINGNASSSDEVSSVSVKPQAPKRQCKSAIIKSEYFNTEQNSNIYEEDTLENTCDKHSFTNVVKNDYTISGIPIKIESDEMLNHQENKVLQEVESLNEPSDVQQFTSQEVLLQSGSSDGVYDNLNQNPVNKIQANITIKNTYSLKDKFSKSMLFRNKHPPLTKSPARPPPIYSKPQIGNHSKCTNPWKTLEDSYLALTSCNRELLIKLVSQASRRRKALLDQFQKLPLQWADFEIDTSEPSVFVLGEKVAYYATVADYPTHPLTLVVSIHERQNHLLENSEIKYPVFGKFTDEIPSELLINSDSELESVPATVLILDRSDVTTIEYFCENLPDSSSEEQEKEICFIILQLIQSMKSLQAQGIESMDSNFQNLLLAKTKQDKYYTLIFLYDIYDENDYSSDAHKISLCQYALLLLFQLLHVQSEEDCKTIKYSTITSRKVFERAIALLSEEKAVSLSQTKTLLECYLWDITRVLETFQDSDECDNILHRWFDIERSNFIKTIINDEGSGDINMQNEYYSQFLIRTTVRNIKEIALHL